MPLPCRGVPHLMRSAWSPGTESPEPRKQRARPLPRGFGDGQLRREQLRPLLARLTVRVVAVGPELAKVMQGGSPGFNAHRAA